MLITSVKLVFFSDVEIISKILKYNNIQNKTNRTDAGLILYLPGSQVNGNNVNVIIAQKKIILYRYYKEMKQSDIANIFGTSQVQISRIEKRALEKMRMSHEGRPLNGTLFLKV